METLAAWWDFIKTDSVAGKIRYFLRNQSGIRSACLIPHNGGTRWTDLAEFMEFIGEKAAVKLHRAYPAGAPYGCWSIRELEGSAERFEFTLRIDTPSRDYPVSQVVVCSAAVERSAGEFASIL